MKYILYLLIVYGSPDNNLMTVIRGPAYESLAACQAAGEQYDLKSQLPVLNAQKSCELEREAQIEGGENDRALR